VWFVGQQAATKGGHQEVRKTNEKQKKKNGTVKKDAIND